MHKVRLLQSAIDDLRGLDKSAANRVAQRVKWLAENVDSISPRRLTGQLAGLCKLREGDYRIIYQVLRSEKIIVIHAIGDRRDIYKRR